jgi:hypothetical protein
VKMGSAVFPLLTNHFQKSSLATFNSKTVVLSPFTPATSTSSGLSASDFAIVNIRSFISLTFACDKTIQLKGGAEQSIIFLEITV